MLPVNFLLMSFFNLWNPFVTGSELVRRWRFSRCEKPVAERSVRRRQGSRRAQGVCLKVTAARSMSGRSATGPTKRFCLAQKLVNDIAVVAGTFWSRVCGVGLMLLATIQIGFSAVEPWQSLVAGNSLELNVLTPASTNTRLPVIVYLKNLAAPRVGTESDEAILNDFRAANYLVATLDYAHATNARAPFINLGISRA